MHKSDKQRGVLIINDIIYTRLLHVTHIREIIDN